MKKSLFIIFITCPVLVFCQDFTISGYVTDKESGEKLIGANIYDPSLQQGTVTNSYGFYSFAPKAADSVHLVVSYTGYQRYTVSLKHDRDFRLNIQLQSSVELDEVVVTSDKDERFENQTQMSQIDIPVAQIKAMPAIMGEVDVLKSLQLLPGVSGGEEGASGLYVRGGGPDQNLILLDGAPVYNASHLFGFFSTFNADAIKNVELIKGGFPARYGGRLSSVIEINMKDGNTQDVKVEGSVGIIASRLTVEGPIKKNKTSFIIAARRTYFDLYATPLIQFATPEDATGGYHFTDFNTKINHKISDKDHLYLSLYYGDDKFFARTSSSYTYQGEESNDKIKAGLGWGNILSAFRWNHLISPKLFSNVSLTYTRYKFYTNASEELTHTFAGTSDYTNYFLGYSSGIHDFAGKIDFDFIPNPNHFIRFGGSHIYHTFNTGAIEFQSSDNSGIPIDTTIGTVPYYSNESAIYAEDEIRLSDWLKINAGIHFSGFLTANKWYPSLEPRISMRILLPGHYSWKTSYARMQQNIHLLSNSTIGLPTDLWVPATSIIPPQTSWQVATGFARTFDWQENEFEVSVEGYYKKMNNIIDYLGGASFLNTSSSWESKVESGTGWSYGGELFIQKKEGKLTGWIGYTLSWTNRQFPTINFGEVYPYKYDRRHDFEITGSYHLNDHIDLSGTWVFSTGDAISLPIASYASYIPNSNFYFNDINYYGSKNSYRMPSYHRLDASISFKKEKRLGERAWVFSLYNAYNHLNPFFIYIGYDQVSSSDLNPVVKKVTIFPIIPSIAYNFKIK